MHPPTADPHQRLRLATRFWACALFALAACSEPARRPNVLLITVDTLRADHLGTYGASRPTPRIDALADSGTVFENAAAPMPMTRPSHFSILTAMYPREHGVVNNAIALPEDALTLQEMLSQRGYRTGAFVAVSLLDAISGTADGFEVVDGPTLARERPASEVVPRALQWLDDVDSEEPFFLWVHLFDPHLPYAPQARFRTDLGLDPALERRYPAGLAWETLKNIAAENDGDVPREILEHAQALYAGEVRAVDYWVGELLDGLDERQRAKDTAVVFTADHGESFGQGVFFEHADCLFQSTMHVPLIVRWPQTAGGQLRAGQRVQEQVSTVDITPTVLELADLHIPSGLSGQPLQQAPSVENRYVLVQHPLYQTRAAKGRAQRQSEIRSVAGEPTHPILVQGEKTGLVGRDWKILREGEQVELYPLGSAPNENTNVAGEAEVGEELSNALDSALERHPLRLIDPGQINPELRETLRALGYEE